jgi:hypothetical protein
MEIRQPADTRSRNALILALKRALENTFDESDWKELGYTTNTHEWISTHPRLLRSLRWGDPDYGGHVLDAIERILDTDPANLQVLANISMVHNWIRENEPTVYAEFFGEGSPVVVMIEDTEKAAEGFDIERYIKRIKDSLPHDPALAIGSTKELLESVLKTILGIHGANLSNEDMPKLLKRAQAALGLEPKDVDPSMLGSEPLRRLLSSLAQIVIAVTELRNLYGTGHGKSNAPGLDSASTNLVVGGGITAASYMMERYRILKEQKSGF